MTTLAARVAAPRDLPEPRIEGLTFAPVTVADTPELTALIARVEEADRSPVRTIESEVAEQFAGSWWQLDRDTRIGRDVDGTPRAWIVSECQPSDQRTLRALSSGGVDPLWRGRGVGTALVRWAQARGRQQLADDGRDMLGRVAAYLLDTQTEAARLYERVGYGPLRYYRDMRRPLDRPLPEPPLTPDVQIVPWTPALDEAVRVAHNEAFRDHWGSEPRSAEAWQQHQAMFAPQWSVLAVSEGQVVGYALCGRYEQDWPVKGYRSGYADLIGVLRPWRGQGIAVALLTAVMAACRADGMEYVELEVDTANPSGAHGLYTSLGFEPTTGTVQWGIEI
ncbi:GNAT family N-acetyltransferase [Cellulomonas sp. NPDC089187]|uniref:GNAT family N-acetyltransferase n=1 Tax=Cellulomonas sp. NPDC089187 TaxID=3154970 RepID=UPI0034470218